MLSKYLIIGCLIITGCSMPSIAVLHDPLTPQEHLQLGLSYEKKGLIEDAIKHYVKDRRRINYIFCRLVI